MSDLVQKLVGALEDLIGIADVAMRRANQDGAEYDRDDELAEARAALSAAKDGGWLPIETAPRGSGIDGPDSVSHPDYVDPPKLLLWTEEGPLVGYYDWYYHPGYGCGAEDGESAWRDHSGAKTYGASAWQPLPAPPAQKEPT